MAVFLLAVCLRVTVGYGGRLFIEGDVLKLVKNIIEDFFDKSCQIWVVILQREMRNMERGEFVFNFCVKVVILLYMSHLKTI